MSSDDPNSSKLKNAASLLVKGGTLTGEPCGSCGGPLIRFKDKTTCISCGEERSIATERKPAQTRDEPGAGFDISSSLALIEKKVIDLTSELAKENDIMLQKQKAELLETYLRILSQLREMAR
jgi:uncharacterized Zn finger protein (UPF0148 family)